MPQELESILALLFAFWMMGNGLAVFHGIATGDPVRSMKRFNLWLLNSVRKLVAGVFQWIANMIRPKKRQNNRRGGHP